MTVVYEWDCELVDEHGDIIEHMHGASYAEVKAWSKSNPCKVENTHSIVLVRDDDEWRSWAYVDDDGKLPVFFQDAALCNVARVPQRFHKEIAKAA